MNNGFARLAIPIHRIDGTVNGWWVIEPSSSSVSLAPEECTASGGPLPKGWRALPCTDGTDSATAPIQIVEQAGVTCIRLLETQSYHWSLEQVDIPAELEVLSSLKNDRDANWMDKRSRDGSFQVINHLGLADFSLLSPELRPLELNFEFISQKFDFDSEYRQLTEDIAGFCQQLLLSWTAPTSLRFSADPEERHKLLLEQFLFLKNFMTRERLNRLLEAISRNPHSQLVKESEWVPAGAARSSDYLSDPCGMLRDWRRTSGRPQPGEVRDVHKSDTHDTAPNRFIKFALSQFRQICVDVCAHEWTEDKKPSTLGVEAKDMQTQLDALLARRFFNEVGLMRRLPLDNQTLQKREGYREVLQAWLLTQAATTLDWEGERDCFKGTTRNVATLYEYWIFIQLHRVLSELPGLEPDPNNQSDPNRFISDKDGQITINLKQGQYSRSRYIWQGQQAKLRIDLQYERTFSRSDIATSSGSYSRSFRPDYTLSIYPDTFKEEAEADAAGQVAHLHFDAKYRAQDIASVFGGTDDAAVTEEKLASKTGRTYKRGDLLKMHTYNDALRHTIGSYVLYPGTKTDEAEKLLKFHEIAPGVGAMVMKPSKEECLIAMQRFLLEVFQHQADTFTQYRYLREADYQTLRYPPETVEENGAAYNIARRDAPCVLLYIHKKNEEEFKKHGYAYCRVENVSNCEPLNLNLSIEIGSEFIPYGGARSETKQTRGWRGKVRAARFIEKNEARAYIQKKYQDATALPSENSKSRYYLIFEFDSVTTFKAYDVDPLHKEAEAHSKYMAISCTWSEILEKATPVEVPFELSLD